MTSDQYDRTGRRAPDRLRVETSSAVPARNYVNDHCLCAPTTGLAPVRHTGSPATSPRSAISPARSAKLTAGAMTESGKVLDGGQKAWAPCVVAHKASTTCLRTIATRLALANDLIPVHGGRIRRPRRRTAVRRTPRPHDHPPQCVHLAHVRHRAAPRRSSIACFVSNDLFQWSRQFALTSSGNAPVNPLWGAFESPFVVHATGCTTSSPPTPTRPGRITTRPSSSAPPVRSTSRLHRRQPRRAGGRGTGRPRG